jgi:hypothetical protein
VLTSYEDRRGYLWPCRHARHRVIYSQRVSGPDQSTFALLLTLASCSLGGDLADEDAKFAAFLEANGWSGEMGASESVDQLVVTEKGEKADY